MAEHPQSVSGVLSLGAWGRRPGHHRLAGRGAQGRHAARWQHADCVFVAHAGLAMLGALAGG
jgi:hypothetical protein